MRFLVDASLPRSATALLRQLGHDAADARDIGLRQATDDVIAAHARTNQQALVTRDFDFADSPQLSPGRLRRYRRAATARQCDRSAGGQTAGNLRSTGRLVGKTSSAIGHRRGLAREIPTGLNLNRRRLR